MPLCSSRASCQPARSGWQQLLNALCSSRSMHGASLRNSITITSPLRVCLCLTQGVSSGTWTTPSDCSLVVFLESATCRQHCMYVWLQLTLVQHQLCCVLPHTSSHIITTASVVVLDESFSNSNTPLLQLGCCLSQVSAKQLELLQLALVQQPVW